MQTLLARTGLLSKIIVSACMFSPACSSCAGENMKVEFHSGKTLELTPADLDDLQRRLDRFKRAPIGLIPGSELELFLVKIWLKKLQIERT